MLRIFTAAAILCLALTGISLVSAIPSVLAQETTAPQSGSTTGQGAAAGRPTTGGQQAPATGKGSGSIASPDGNTLTFGEVATALGKLFVAAVILESAFAVIFKSKLYQEFFNGRGLTTPLLVVFCYMVASAFGIDRVLDAVLSGLAPVPPGTVPAEAASGHPAAWSTLLTALTLAGGSAGVNSMLQAFGYRVPPPPPAAQKPPETKAWISVRVLDPEGRAVAAIFSIEAVTDPAATHLKEVAGITHEGTTLDRLRRLVLPDQLRFPRYGGHTVDAGTVYAISATPLNSKLRTEPVVASFAQRAIVDLTVIAKQA